MIEGMVAKLAARLEKEPDDAAGWTQLRRSYIAGAQRADGPFCSGGDDILQCDVWGGFDFVRHFDLLFDVESLSVPFDPS